MAAHAYVASENMRNPLLLFALLLYLAPGTWAAVQGAAAQNLLPLQETAQTLTEDALLRC